MMQRIALFLLALGSTVLAQSVARDYPQDGAGLRIGAPRLTINGKPAGSDTKGAGGPVVWFYVAGRGRFVLSLAPNESFQLQRAGQVQGNKISFKWRDDEYEILCDGRIAPESETYTLYVAHDSSFRPSTAQSRAPFSFGAARGPEHVLPRVGDADGQQYQDYRREPKPR